MQWGALEVALALRRAIVLARRRREFDSNEFNALLSGHSDRADVSDDTAMRGGLRPFESDLDRLAEFELHGMGKGVRDSSNNASQRPRPSPSRHRSGH